MSEINRIFAFLKKFVRTINYHNIRDDYNAITNYANNENDQFDSYSEIFEAIDKLQFEYKHPSTSEIRELDMIVREIFINTFEPSKLENYTIGEFFVNIVEDEIDLDFINTNDIFSIISYFGAKNYTSAFNKEVLYLISIIALNVDKVLHNYTPYKLLMMTSNFNRTYNPSTNYWEILLRRQ